MPHSFVFTDVFINDHLKFPHCFACFSSHILNLLWLNWNAVFFQWLTLREYVMNIIMSQVFFSSSRFDPCDQIEISSERVDQWKCFGWFFSFFFTLWKDESMFFDLFVAFFLSSYKHKNYIYKDIFFRKICVRTDKDIIHYFLCCFLLLSLRTYTYRQEKEKGGLDLRKKTFHCCIDIAHCCRQS